MTTDETAEYLRSMYKDVTKTLRDEDTLNTNVVVTCTVMSDAELLAKLEESYDAGYDQGYWDGRGDQEDLMGN